MTETPQATPAAKRNRIGKKSYSEDSASVTFEFSDGEKITVAVSEFAAPMQKRLAQYGVGQKFGDAYAGCKTPKEAREELATMVAQIKAGDWRIKAEGGPKSGKTVRALFRMGEANGKLKAAVSGALKISGPYTLETVRDGWAAASKETKSALSSATETKVELAKMSTEEAQTGASLLS